MIKRIALLFLSLVCSSTIAADNFWESDVWSEKDRGFLWYPDPETQKQTPKDPDLKSFTTVEELKAERVRRMERAIMDPSQENMASYLEANHFVQEKSALFTDNFRRALWQYPEYDFSVKNPAANFAQVNLSADRKTQRNENLKSIAKSWGLVYFHTSECRFCKMQSPLIKQLADTFGFEILPITLDGVAGEHFPDALPDNGIADLLTNGKGVAQVPALFIVNREGTQSFPISTGILSIEDMMKRIELTVAIPEGKSLFGGADVQ